MAMVLGALAVTPALAQQDVRGVKPVEPALKVIEEKCLICHNKKRIDAAVKERKDMEKILRRMEKKGVVLTENERRVMGHFRYERPLKGKEGEATPQEKKGGGGFSK
jgi:hypothetical protein